MAHVEITPDMKHVSIPISLPYWTAQSEYRVTNGKIVINGSVYRKVMQKYDQEAIHLIVAKDTDTEKLNHSIADWVRAMSDGEANSEGGSDLIKSAVKDYVPVAASSWSSEQIALTLDKTFGVQPTVALSSRCSEVTTPPPQA